MKKILACIITLSVLISCQKDDNTPDPVKDALSTLQGKYLVCDSVKTTVSGISTTQILGKGKGWDRTFGFYGNLEIYSSPVTYKNYSYESPNKIYYWNNGSSYQSDVYYTILSATSAKMVLAETEQSTGKVFTEYFTAQ